MKGGASIGQLLKIGRPESVAKSFGGMLLALSINQVDTAAATVSQSQSGSIMEILEGWQTMSQSQHADESTY